MLAVPLLLAVAALSPEFPDPQCLLLGKGDGFAFHAVRSGYRAPATRPDAKPGKNDVLSNPYGSDSQTIDHPWLITHTDLRTGRMTKLFQGGSWHFRDGSPFINRGMRTADFRAYPAAFAADDRHLYLVSVTATERSAVGRGDKTVTCTLRVYRGRDGRLAASYPVDGFTETWKSPPLPFARPEPPADLVRLPLTADGLKVGATAFRYRDGVLTPVAAPADPPRP